MSIRSEISTRLLRALGPGLWKEFWVAFAQKLKDAEKSYKSVPGAGKLKAVEVKAWAHARLAPLLPDFSEAAIFGYLDTILDTVIEKLNSAIGQDWVGAVEDLEHLVAVYLEPFLDVDLDEDGAIGAGAAKTLALLLAVGLSLVNADSCRALDHTHRPLVEHNRFDETTGTQLPPLPGTPAPRSDDVRSVGPSLLSAVAVSTWTGYRTNGRAGKGTWDGGLGLTLKASSTWQPSILFGKGGVGGGLAYKRVGALAFWDGTLMGGLYVRPWDF